MKTARKMVGIGIADGDGLPRSATVMSTKRAVRPWGVKIGARSVSTTLKIWRVVKTARAMREIWVMLWIIVAGFIVWLVGVYFMEEHKMEPMMNLRVV